MASRQLCTSATYFFENCGRKVEKILLKILDWLRVVIKNPESREKAWELIHSLLGKCLKKEWLDIVGKAVEGQLDQALAALNAAEDAIKKVFQANKEFMENIRRLGDEYYPGILGGTIAGALSGAGMGGCGGAVVGGPLGAGLGAVVGATAGAFAGFYAAGANAVYIYKHQKNKQM